MLPLWQVWGCTFSTSPFQHCENTNEPQLCLMEEMNTQMQNKRDIQELLDACSLLTDRSLKGECYFLVSDESKLTGDNAREVCRFAEPFSEDCLRHAAAREVEQSIFATLENSQPNPMRVLPRIHGVVRNYLPAEIAEPMARDMVLRFQASRIGSDFDTADCLGLQSNLCSQVYILAALGSREQWTKGFEEPWMLACGRDITVQDAEGWSWPHWQGEMDAVVQNAMQQICQALPTAPSTPLIENGVSVPAANVDSSK